jgi:MFS family permease
MGSFSSQDQKNSILDGAFANVFATLTGGVFLTGFALHLGMDEFAIGLIAAMPFLVTVFQLPISYLIDRKGGRKKLAYWSAGVARAVWLPILALALVPESWISFKTGLIVSLIFLSYAFVSISYVCWLSWMSDLVPEGARGSFFGSRNMVNGAAGMLAMVLFGQVLDYLKDHLKMGLTLGFGVVFAIAVFSGLWSLRFLNRVSEPRVNPSVSPRPFRDHVALPLKETNFRRLSIFALLWSFSVHFASPFFTLYFLRNLEFSYGFVAALGLLSSLSDLIGMRVWGKISDKVKNKAIIRVSSWVVAFLPFAWVTVSPGDVIMPIFLHIIGGGFWAGINLCMNNLLMKLSPQGHRSVFLSTYNILAGLGAAAGPILAGSFLKSMGGLDLQLLSWKVLPLHVVFLISFISRLVSLQVFRSVREPEEVTVGQMVRIIRGVRGLNVATGFNFILHPFIEIAGGNREYKSDRTQETTSPWIGGR